ncbi:MAG: shikimate dehydrogenase [Crocinitomicaceae bacterium]
MHAFGLIGKSLSHSFSKDYFGNKFEKLNLDYSYQNFECHSLAEVEALLAKSSCTGFNVTSPYKTKVIDLLDSLDESASVIGAVNTICKEKGLWVGYNTDIYGFKQMIKPFFESHHERAVIIGTGGASKAVEYVLEELGSNIIFISRSPSKKNEFAYSDINRIMLNSCFIIVNATPVGTFPNINTAVEIPYEYLTSKHLVIDLVYNPNETVFVRQSKNKGATAINGLTMLHQQAEKAWMIWQNVI